MKTLVLTTMFVALLGFGAVRASSQIFAGGDNRVRTQQTQPSATTPDHSSRACPRGTPVQPEENSSWRYGLPGHKMMVTNATGYYMVFSVGKPSATNALAPGEIASTEIKSAEAKKGSFWKKVNPFSAPGFVGYARSSDVEVPIVAFFYADSAHQQYVGASVTKITIPGYGYSSGYALIFRPENIAFGDGVPCDGPLAGAAPSQGMKPLVIDFAYGEGTGIWVIVWNGSSPVRIVMNGVDRGVLEQGQRYYLSTTSMVNLTLSAQDQDGKLRLWSRSFSNQIYYGVYVHELSILTERDLR